MVTLRIKLDFVALGLLLPKNGIFYSLAYDEKKHLLTLSYCLRNGDFNNKDEELFTIENLPIESVNRIVRELDIGLSPMYNDPNCYISTRPKPGPPPQPQETEP